MGFCNHYFDQKILKYNRPRLAKNMISLIDRFNYMAFKFEKSSYIHFFKKKMSSF